MRFILKNKSSPSFDFCHPHLALRFQGLMIPVNKNNSEPFIEPREALILNLVCNFKKSLDTHTHVDIEIRKEFLI